MLCWPRRRDIPRPTAGRALRRYLSDKRRLPPSRRARHVARRRPVLLTPLWARGTPQESRTQSRAGWRGLPSRGELAPVMSLTTAPDISGYGPGPSSRYRPPPRPRPNLGRDPGLGRGGGEGNHGCVCSGNVLVLWFFCSKWKPVF